MRIKRDWPHGLRFQAKATALYTLEVAWKCTVWSCSISWTPHMTPPIPNAEKATLQVLKEMFRLISAGEVVEQESNFNCHIIRALVYILLETPAWNPVTIRVGEPIELAKTSSATPQTHQKSHLRLQVQY